jgi:hypothetical protein
MCSLLLRSQIMTFIAAMKPIMTAEQHTSPATELFSVLAEGVLLFGDAGLNLTDPAVVAEGMQVALGPVGDDSMEGPDGDFDADDMPACFADCPALEPVVLLMSMFAAMEDDESDSDSEHFLSEDSSDSDSEHFLSEDSSDDSNGEEAIPPVVHRPIIHTLPPPELFQTACAAIRSDAAAACLATCPAGMMTADEHARLENTACLLNPHDLDSSSGSDSDSDNDHPVVVAPTAATAVSPTAPGALTRRSRRSLLQSSSSVQLAAVAEAIASMNVVLRDTATPPAGPAGASANPSQALAALYAAALSSQRDLPTQISGLVSGAVTPEAFQAATSVQSLAATAAATVLPPPTLPHPTPTHILTSVVRAVCLRWQWLLKCSGRVA